MTRASSPLMLALLFVAFLALSPAFAADWDPRLDALHVSLTAAADCSQGCWRLITARYEDVDESGLNHNVYSRLYDESGSMIAGAPWHVAWPDGDITIYSKAPPEWADFPIFACYNPANGPGPYYAYAGDNIDQSDVVRGLGLPQCQHVNFRLEWQWTREEPPPELPFQWWLPIAASGD